MPGTGPLAERVDAFQDRFVVPRDRLDAVMRAAIDECRRRTVAPYRSARGRELHPRVRHRQELVAATIGTRAITTASSRSTPTCRCASAAPSISAATKAIPATTPTTPCSSEKLARGRGWVEYRSIRSTRRNRFIAEGSANYGIELAFPGQRAARLRDRHPLSARRPAARPRRRLSRVAGGAARPWPARASPSPATISRAGSTAPGRSS